MNKQKITIILVAIFIVLGASASWYSFNRNQIITHNKGCDMSGNPCLLEIVPRTIWEVITDRLGSVAPGYVPARFGPTNRIGCNQSATTTPCSQITDIQNVLPTPIQQAQESVASFAFGPLLNVYEDKEFGFSLKYPVELEIKPSESYANSGVFLGMRGENTGFYLKINGPNNKSLFANPLAQSLNDYSENYVLKKEGQQEVRVFLIDTEDIVTSSGAHGIKQKWKTLWYNEKRNTQEAGNNDPKTFSTRYIFHVAQKGFYIIESNYSVAGSYYTPEDFYRIDPFRELENKIIDTVKL